MNKHDEEGGSGATNRPMNYKRHLESLHALAVAKRLLELGYDPKAPASLEMESGSAAIITTDSLWGESAASVA